MDSVEADYAHCCKMHLQGFEYFEHRGMYYSLGEYLSSTGNYIVTEVKPTPEMKGAITCLWEVFGGKLNAAGYKELDAHIGLIYGDSITPQRAVAILNGLKAKGFASTNIVFGIGSFTYQYCTRDTYGFAMKATYAVVNGEGRNIFKDPATDNGLKKSAKGILAVRGMKLYPEQEHLDVQSDLVPVFKDGKLLVEQSLTEIRARVKG